LTSLFIVPFHNQTWRNTMSENEMLREFVQESTPRQVFHRDSTRHDLREWNVQMYYEAMGMDFGHEDDYVEEQQ